MAVPGDQSVFYDIGGAMAKVPTETHLFARCHPRGYPAAAWLACAQGPCGQAGATTHGITALAARLVGILAALTLQRHRGMRLAQARKLASLQARKLARSQDRKIDRWRRPLARMQLVAPCGLLSLSRALALTRAQGRMFMPGVSGGRSRFSAVWKGRAALGAQLGLCASLALGLGLPCGGCGGGSASSTSAAGSITGSTDGSYLTCDTETRAMPYLPGMHVASSAGAFELKLLASVPGPPVKGNNTWSVEIDDGTSGAPLDGLVVSVSPWMPDHGHGTEPVVVTPMGGSGRYSLMPVYLYMSGLWQVQFGIKSVDGVSPTQDQAVLPICIP